MSPYKVFSMVLVAGLLLPCSLRAPSEDFPRDRGPAALADAGPALDRFPESPGPVGVDTSWSAGIASRIEQEEYRPSRTAHGLQAPNRAHNLRTRFGPGGIEVGPRERDEGAEDGAWRVTWQTTQWGRAGRLADLGSPAIEPRLEGARVTYAHAGIDEWYENRKEGLEQGFTVHERPTGLGSLVVAGRLGGGLRPEAADADGAIDLLDERGARALRYGGLHVWDAEGTELPARFEVDGIEVAIVIEDDGAAYPLTIDPLLTTPAWTGESNQVVASFGSSVATAGDVNGDGFSDVIVGAWLYDNGETDEGRAFVYLGSAFGLSLAPAWTVESNQASTAFGYSVATAGDVNGDGFSDVVVGAFKYDNGETDEGRAFVYHGSASGLGLTPAWVAESDQAGAVFGLCAATAGDVNGDGFSDVIVGALAYDNGETDEGRAFVYHGSAAGLGTTAVWNVESNQATSEFGATVATAGDVNGDGFSDVIIGASIYDNGESDEGRAFVYHGSVAGLGATAVWTAESDQANGRLGNCVATAGDVNGDGFSDVIVGVWQYDNGQPNEGRAYAYHGSASGLAASPAWSAESNQTTSRYGWCVAPAGDVNGDGFADVIVGAFEYDNVEVQEGRAFVYHGSAAGLGGEVWRTDPNQANARFGYSVATAGDVNGDGFSDVIVGADQYDSGESNEGRAFVYLGSAGAFGPGSGWTAESNQASSNFGVSVATAGDVNGDGFSDVIVGASAYDNGQTSEGRAFVYYGAASGLGTTPAWTAESNQAQAMFGDCVASAGDINGDGFSDVIVGASGFTSGEAHEGRTFVYHGSAAGLGTTAAWTAEPNQAEANFGSSVATAGDVNGDGFSDVVVGAPAYDFSDAVEGRTYVYHGSAAGLATTAAWTAGSGIFNAHFGTSVGSAGDVNGDGFSDVIVGAQQASNGEFSEGRAFVYHGSAVGLGLTAAQTVESNQHDAYFGGSVATAGDVNGDGFSDVIVGATGYSNGENNEGRAFVYHGSAAGLVTNAAWTAESDQIDAWFGISVATSGDVNGDGFSDVIVGASRYDVLWTDDGRAFLYLGSPTGLDFAPAWRGQSLQDGANFGWSVGMAGDVNGDGSSDVIVGAIYAHNGEAIEGRAFVSYGNEGLGRATNPRQLRTDGVVPIAQLGRSNSATEFRIRANMLSIYGRTRLQMEHEVKPHGVLFNGSSTVVGSFADIGSDGTVDVTRLVSGLTPDTRYHWRVRAKYDLTKTPFQRNGPWVHMPLNGWNEADLRMAVSVSTDVATSSSGAPETLLDPVAPNPVTENARLSYRLPETGSVRLAIYDVSGREVVVLADGIQDSGPHATAWDRRTETGRRIPAGVYFARLEFGGRVEARKVVLAR